MIRKQIDVLRLDDSCSGCRTAGSVATAKATEEPQEPVGGKSPAYSPMHDTPIVSIVVPLFGLPCRILSSKLVKPKK